MTVNSSVPLRSTTPARLDRLSWSPFHTRMPAGLFGVKAEGQSLETITKPLTAVADAGDAGAAGSGDAGGGRG